MPVYPTIARLGLTGDVMLGRLIDERILGDPGMDPSYVWGDMLEPLGAMDACLINLECVIASSGAPEAGKVFAFRARPRAIEALTAAGVTFAGLANDHVLDYGPDAMLECLAHLRAAGIAAAGAGRDLEEAARASVITASAMRIGVVAMTDNEPGWEAGGDRPGVNVVRCDASGLTGGSRDRIRAAINGAREAADFIIVCAHLGPNWGPPSRATRAVAHQVLEDGAHLYWGHSNHTVQAVELSGGRGILYSTGDFVDDYAVDPEERNDLSFLFEVLVRNGSVEALRLHPVRVEGLRVRRAPPDDACWLRRRLEVLAAASGTSLE